MNLFEIVSQIPKSISSAPYIHALWLEGSWATGKNDVHSDIDVWMDVDDGCFVAGINDFRECLKSLGKIDWEEERGMYCQQPRLVKHIFHLEGFSSEQTVELDIQEHSRLFVFDKNEHALVVLFDKDDTIKWKK